MKVDLGKNISLDIYKLMTTRLLIQANSGGGKSWAIRKILEQTHGKVQQIVLDIEGDYSSLREKFDFVLAGKGGDIPAEVRSAELLARKILELKSDLIVDLYELKQADRIRFVRAFLESMINAPKTLWQPVLVVLDEAHIFCPEKGHAESWSAVVDMATRGRKRGYCLIMATQRLAKLHKDAAAEMNNKMIGRTTLDVDLKRAGDEIGFQLRDWPKIKNLEPGDFYLYGPALSKQVELGRVGEIETRHPKAGKIGKFHSPAPSSKVKSVLAKLTDLPKEAASELKEKSDLQSRIRELERELREAKAAAPKIDKLQFNHLVEREVREIKKQLEKDMLKNLSDLRARIADALSMTPKNLAMPEIKLLAVSNSKNDSIFKPKLTASVHTKEGMKKVQVNEVKMGACERAILGFLATRPDREFTKVQVGALTGYRHSSGGFNNAISKLVQAGFVKRTGGMLQLCDLEAVQEFISEVPHSIEDWKKKLGKCEREIFSWLLLHDSDFIPKDQLAEQVGYSAGSGGFNNALSRLSTLGLIVRDRERGLRINHEVTKI